MKQERLYYPVFMNLTGRKCAVAGGGKVAWRKVKSLLDASASVTVISPALCPELEQLAEKNTIHILRKTYVPADLEGAVLVIAATDEPDTNRKVAEEARRRGIPVNVVDNAEQSDFIAPSYLRRGDLTIAVSTAGDSPALSRKIRTQLEQTFGTEYISLVALVGEVRNELKQRGITPSSDKWQEALDLNRLITLVQAGQIEEAKATLLKRLLS
ncbi:MAG: bifunctional precorrin-2 dehydrogenase/sirohydrochlorin ferrochelatase [Chloroflexota bacterium]